MIIRFSRGMYRTVVLLALVAGIGGCIHSHQTARSGEAASTLEEQRVSQALLARLWYWRKSLVHRYSPFSRSIMSESLEAIARVQPTTLEGLQEIVGKWRAKKYGAEILEIIRGYQNGQKPPWVQPWDRRPKWAQAFDDKGKVIPRQELSHIRSIEKKINIAVADLKTHGLPEPEAALASEMLRSAMVNTGIFRVADRTNMDHIMMEQKVQVAVCTTGESAADLGKILKVDKMVFGSLSRIKDKYYLTANIVNVETAEIEASQKINAESLDHLNYSTSKLADLLAQDYSN